MKLPSAAFALLVLGAVSAAGQTFTEFPGAVTPLQIASGPDGNLWFTEYSIFGNSIGRITLDGEITKFSLPYFRSLPSGITAGPDGNLWFAEVNGNRIGRITTSGAITEFSVPGPPIGLTMITTG